MYYGQGQEPCILVGTSVGGFIGHIDGAITDTTSGILKKFDFNYCMLLNKKKLKKNYFMLHMASFRNYHFRSEVVNGFLLNVS